MHDYGNRAMSSYLSVFIHEIFRVNHKVSERFGCILVATLWCLQRLDMLFSPCFQLNVPVRPIEKWDERVGERMNLLVCVDRVGWKGILKGCCGMLNVCTMLWYFTRGYADMVWYFTKGSLLWWHQWECMRGYVTKVAWLSSHLVRVETHTLQWRTFAQDLDSQKTQCHDRLWYIQTTRGLW